MDVEVRFRDLSRSAGHETTGGCGMSAALAPSHASSSTTPAVAAPETGFSSAATPCADQGSALRIDWIRVAAITGCVGFWSLILHVV